jgi:hypothetical protein
MATIATGYAEDTVSDWAAPVVGGLVSAAVDTAGEDYQAYGGNKVADTSDLQSQAFTGIAGLAAPGSVTDATNNLQSVYNTATTQAPYSGATIGNQFDAPDAYSPTTATSGYTAPAAYTGGTFNAGPVSAGLGAPGSVESYMNPYLQNVVDVQAREARRQSDIQRATDAKKFQGGFGGGRQALYNAENVRNVNQQIGDIQAKGSQAAYDTALKQRLAEGEQYRLGQEATSKLGLEAQKMGEDSRQFGSKQGLASAELAAKYGLDAQKLTEDSRQFGAKQGLLSAEADAKYGLEGLKESEQSRQFGAGLGLKYLTEAGNAATNMGQIGVNQGNFNLNRLKSMADMGATQRGITQAGLTSDYNDFVEERDYDKTQQKYLKDILSGIPMTTRNQYIEAPSAATGILAGGLTAAGVYEKLYGGKTT